MAKKGYWIAFVDVNNPEQYKGYQAENAVAFRKYGARFLARGGPFETMEGRTRSRCVVIEFKDFATALACYRSAEYQKAKGLRAGASEADFIVMEGYDGPQPADG